jgi:ribosomal protein S18 acetylase RimI-like enzyme
MPDLTLRPAGAGDVRAVLRFWATAAEDANRPADTVDAVAALIARDPGALILAELGTELVGTVVAGWDGWRCHLYRLAVAPGHRGRGIGRTLVVAAEQRFRALGGTRATAMVLDDNAPAHGIWRALGYVPQAEWSRWVKTLNSDRQV